MSFVCLCDWGDHCHACGVRSVSLCDIGANLITIRVVTCLLSVAGIFRIDDCRSCPLLLVATVTVVVVVVVIVARTGRAVL